MPGPYDFLMAAVILLGLALIAEWIDRRVD